MSVTAATASGAAGARGDLIAKLHDLRELLGRTRKSMGEIGSLATRPLEGDAKVSSPPALSGELVDLLAAVLSSKDLQGALPRGGLSGDTWQKAKRVLSESPTVDVSALEAHLSSPSDSAAVPVTASALPPPPPSAPRVDIAEQKEEDGDVDDDLYSRYSVSPFRGQLDPRLEEEEDDNGHPAARDVEELPFESVDISAEEFEDEELRQAELRSAKERMLAMKRERQLELAREARARGTTPPRVDPEPVQPQDDPSIIETRSAVESAKAWMAATPEGGGSRWSTHWPAPEGVDESDQPKSFACFNLRIVYEAGRTGFAEDKDYKPRVGSVVAGRYRITRRLGSAAFSQAVAAIDSVTGLEVCLKIVKNNKEYLDQSLDEIKLLEYLNRRAMSLLREHSSGGDAPLMAKAATRVLRLLDFFYYKEHLFLVSELLKDNLYEFQKFVFKTGAPTFFTLPRVQTIARQVLSALDFVHSLGIIHCDLKPENLLLASYSKCKVKVIDFGSSCFITDHLTSYIQSRSYRAPEVILGLPYGPKIDVWSLGCILFELATGRVLFVNDSVPVILSRMEGILGKIPEHLIDAGSQSHSFFTQGRDVYEHVEEGGDELFW
jgi:tRNA A-37 threonylcarbamoyl transferase component Bud32